MKHLFFLFMAIFLFGLSSCDLFDDDEPVEGTECILIKSVFDIPNDPAKSEVDYIYDSNNYLIEVESTDIDLGNDPWVTRWIITYASDKMNEINKYEQDDLVRKMNFFYNGELIDSVHYSYHGVYGGSGYYLLEYDSEKLKKVVHYYLSGQATDHVYYGGYELVWTGENVTQIMQINANSETNVTNYTYDDKKALIRHMGIVMADLSRLNILSDNNVLTVRYTSQNQTFGRDQTWEYNDQGYPVSYSWTDIQSGYNQPPTIFTYDCN